MNRIGHGWAIVAAALVALGTAEAFAHEKKLPSPPPTTASEPAELEPEPSAEEPEGRPEMKPIVISPRDALLGHPHNKIVHFPLALGFAGALFLLLSYRRPQYFGAARLLLLLAATAAVGAYFTGEAQSEDLEGGGLDQVLTAHERMGKISGILLGLTAALAFVPKARRFLWLLALALLASLSFTGLLGGILSHTPV